MADHRRRPHYFRHSAKKYFRFLKLPAVFTWTKTQGTMAAATTILQRRKDEAMNYDPTECSVRAENIGTIFGRLLPLLLVQWNSKGSLNEQQNSQGPPVPTTSPSSSSVDDGS
jgi:hypothetical protein